MSRAIFFNGKFYSGRLNGVHRVADRLIRECDRLLSQRPRAERPAAYLLTSREATWVPQLEAIERRNFARTGHLWEQVVLPRAARGGVLVNLANLAPLAHARKITMIHDAQFLFRDCGYPRRQRWGYRWLTPLLGRSSRAVITVSEFSRRMLDTFAVANAANVGVVANGADHILEARINLATLPRLDLEPNGYAVMFGSPKAYKNNAVVFAAFADGALAPTRLVVVGPERMALEAAGLAPPPDALFAGAASDSELKALLSGASALLFPSRTEGFGLPPLEAMLSDCPVIASPAGAIPEVCGDAVLYAAPDDPAEWRAALVALRDSHVLRQSKIAAGRTRAAGFTWSAAGRKLMDTIDRLAREP